MISQPIENKNVISIYQNLNLGVKNKTHIQVSGLIIVSVAIISWAIKHFGIIDYSTDSDNDDLGGGIIQCHQDKVVQDSCETFPGIFSGRRTKDSSLVQIRIFLFFLEILIFRG